MAQNLIKQTNRNLTCECNSNQPYSLNIQKFMKTESIHYKYIFPSLNLICILLIQVPSF